MADPGEGPAPPPPLFLDQTEARRAEKYFFGDQLTPLPHIRVWMTALPPVSKSGSSTGADFANYLSIRSEKYGLSLYISREKGDHHYIQTWHKDRFSHYNLILKKLQEKMS